MAKENEIFSSCMTCFYYVPGLGFPESRVMSFPIASALPGPDSRSVENGSEVTEVVVDGFKLFRAPDIRIQYSSCSYVTPGKVVCWNLRRDQQAKDNTIHIRPAVS